jgi:hypothetical protein
MQKEWSADTTILQRLKGWDEWGGSYYELAMLYPSSSMEQQDRLRLFQFLWNDPNLLGVVHYPTEFGEAWQSLDAINTKDADHYYGCIRLPEGSIIGCGSFFTHYGDETWFSLYMPLWQIGWVRTVEYPLSDERNTWIKPMDAFLASIGARVYEYMPFTIAELAEEAGGSLKYIQDHLAHMDGCLIPEAMFRQNGITPYGLRVGKDLWWAGGNYEGV